MRDEIQKEILIDLYVAKDYVPMKYFMDRFDYSERTIRNCIRDLNDLDLNILYKRNKGYYLENKGKALPFLKIDAVNNSVEDNERLIRMMQELALLLTCRKHISLTDISERLYISKTTAKNDMDEIVRELSDYGIIIKKDRCGHRCELDLTRRIHLLLGILHRKHISTQECDHLFSFLLEKEIDYASLFRTVAKQLTEYQWDIDDATIMYFTNYLILLDAFDLEEEAFQNVIVSENIHIEINALLAAIEPYFQLDEKKQKDALHVYCALIHHLPNREIEEKAHAILNDFIKICDVQHDLLFSQEESLQMEEMFLQMLIDREFYLFHEDEWNAEIRRNFIESYEIALELKYVFESYSLICDDSFIAAFAMYINEGLILRNESNTDKVDIYLINDCEYVMLLHVYSGIFNTVDTRFYNFRVISLYAFNTIASSLKKENTIILDTKKRSADVCIQYGLTYHTINPLLYQKDIQFIAHEVTQKRKERRRNENLMTLARVKDRIHVHVKDRSPLENIHFEILIRNTLLLIRSEEWNNTLDIYVREDPLKVIYGPDEHTQTGKDLSLVKNIIIKRVPLEQLMRVRTDQELIKLLEEAIYLDHH